mmetsp:Transcript_45241/g.52979  ORF Transcript_45241/g.52979 Transcript_45241/m.52979 type:complete len:93 (-) Transcript_45241:457-735(-)
MVSPTAPRQSGNQSNLNQGTADGRGQTRENPRLGVVKPVEPRAAQHGHDCQDGGSVDSVGIEDATEPVLEREEGDSAQNFGYAGGVLRSALR